jgi:short-subunit dehydrogenase
MRKQKGGKIICISSVAAVYSIPFQAYYSASKAAINAFVDALTNEVKPFGIEITSVMPGDISTGFTAARSKTSIGDDIYSGIIGSAVSAMEKDENNGMTPDSVADLVVKLALKKRVAPLYTVGIQYKALVFLSRIFPHKTAVKIVGKMYK